MSRSDRSFAHRLAQSKRDREVNLLRWQFKPEPFKAPTKESLWVRIKTRVSALWTKVKEYIND